MHVVIAVREKFRREIVHDCLHAIFISGCEGFMLICRAGHESFRPRHQITGKGLSGVKIMISYLYIYWSPGGSKAGSISPPFMLILERGQQCWYSLHWSPCHVWHGSVTRAQLCRFLFDVCAYLTSKKIQIQINVSDHEWQKLVIQNEAGRAPF